MKILKKMLGVKHEIKECMENEGVKVAVSKYSLQTLLKYGFLEQYPNTELYKEEFEGLLPAVYNKDGDFLGLMSILMANCYKNLGGVEVPCLNGNVILFTQADEKGERYPSTTFGVFDKTGKNIVPYGKYFSWTYVPDGVALKNGYGNQNVNVTTVYYTGDVQEEDYINIEEIFADKTTGKRQFEVFRKDKSDAEVIILEGVDNGHTTE